jgi:ribosomal protein L33
MHKKGEIAYIETCNNVNTLRGTIHRMQITKFCKSIRRHLFKLENRHSVVLIVFAYELR